VLTSCHRNDLISEQLTFLCVVENRDPILERTLYAPSTKRHEAVATSCHQNGEAVTAPVIHESGTVLDGELLVMADFRAFVEGTPLVEALASCPLEVIDHIRAMAEGFILFQVTRAGATMHPEDTAAWVELSTPVHVALLARLVPRGSRA